MSKISGCVSTISLLIFATCLTLPAQAMLLDPAEIDAARLLPPPPMAGSAAAKAEVGELHAIAASSTAAMLDAARRDDADKKPDLFNAALGFDITALPAANKMLNDVLKEEDTDSKAAKAYFHRDRPWIVDASIKTCVMVKPGPAANSYPSGHASLAFSMGVVLAAVMPQKAQVILARLRVRRTSPGLRRAFPQRYRGGPAIWHRVGAAPDGQCRVQDRDGGRARRIACRALYQLMFGRIYRGISRNSLPSSLSS